MTKLTPVGLSYRHSSDDVSEYPASYRKAVRDRIYNIARGDYSWEYPSLENQLGATQRILANVIELLVNKGMMNSEEFQEVLEISSHRPDYKLIPEDS